MKQAFLALMLLALGVTAGLGVAHIIRPHWFANRSGVRRGGSMLKEWNGLSFQVFGIVIVAAVVYLFYSLLKR